MSATTFRRLAEVEDPERFISAALPWVHEAARAYFDWFFDGPENAERSLRRWMARGTSEFSIRRVTMLFEEDRPAGGYVAATQPQLDQSRRADIVAALRDVEPARRAVLLERVATVQRVVPPVESDEFYLSAIGVPSNFRGSGRRRPLVLAFNE